MAVEMELMRRVRLLSESEDEAPVPKKKAKGKKSNKKT